MALYMRTPDSEPGNLGPVERWGSLVAGAFLTLAALGRGGALRRTALSAAGLTLLSRGAAGHCAAKAALTGQTSLRDGVREQWERLRSGYATEAARIEDMEGMYLAELQELHSAQAQLGALLDTLTTTLSHEPLRQHLRGYATEISSRRQDLARILSSRGVNPREHPDQAMRALISETRKMAHVSGANVRDAALVASLQRIIHYTLAGFGAVAAYAKTLGYIDEAARFAEYADRDKGVDQELTDLAKGTLNPEARLEPRGHEPPPARPH